MKAIIPIFFLLISLSATAQYKKIGVEGRQWNEYEEFMMGGTAMSYYQISGDSLVDGKLLPRLVEVDFSGNFIKTVALIKEDSLAPSITYFFANQSFPAYGDSLFLDLSLNVGDSAAYLCKLTGVTSYYFLDSTGTFTDAQGLSRKQYFFHAKAHMGADIPFNWVEGIGSTTWGGVTYFVPLTCFNDGPPIPELLCVTDTFGINIYKNPVRDTCEMSIGLSHYEIQDFELYPNPVKDILNISSGVPLEFLRIYDLQGNLLRQVHQPKEQIDMKGIPAGLYILQAEGRNAEQATTKLRILKN